MGKEKGKGEGINGEKKENKREKERKEQIEGKKKKRIIKILRK